MKLEEAIEGVLATLEGSTLAEVNPEYLRGQVNLLAELFPVEGMTTSDRMAEIHATLKQMSLPEPTLGELVAEVLRESPIVWPNAGDRLMDTYEGLTAQIMQVVRDNTTYEGE